MTTDGTPGHVRSSKRSGGGVEGTWTGAVDDPEQVAWIFRYCRRPRFRKGTNPLIDRELLSWLSCNRVAVNFSMCYEFQRWEGEGRSPLELFPCEHFGGTYQLIIIYRFILNVVLRGIPGLHRDSSFININLCLTYNLFWVVDNSSSGSPPSPWIVTSTNIDGRGTSRRRVLWILAGWCAGRALSQIAQTVCSSSPCLTTNPLPFTRSPRTLFGGRGEIQSKFTSTTDSEYTANPRSRRWTNQFLAMHSNRLASAYFSVSRHSLRLLSRILGQ